MVRPVLLVSAAGWPRQHRQANLGLEPAVSGRRRRPRRVAPKYRTPRAMVRSDLPRPEGRHGAEPRDGRCVAPARAVRTGCATLCNYGFITSPRRCAGGRFLRHRRLQSRGDPVADPAFQIPISRPRRWPSAHDNWLSLRPPRSRKRRATDPTRLKRGRRYDGSSGIAASELSTRKQNKPAAVRFSSSRSSYSVEPFGFEQLGSTPT